MLIAFLSILELEKKTNKQHVTGLVEKPFDLLNENLFNDKCCALVETHPMFIKSSQTPSSTILHIDIDFN